MSISTVWKFSYTCKSFQTFLRSFNEEYNLVIRHFHKVKKGLRNSVKLSTRPLPNSEIYGWMLNKWEKKNDNLHVPLTSRNKATTMPTLRASSRKSRQIKIMFGLQWRNKENVLNYKILRQGGNLLTVGASTKVLISGSMLPIKTQWDHQAHWLPRFQRNVEFLTSF